MGAIYHPEAVIGRALHFLSEAVVAWSSFRDELTERRALHVRARQAGKLRAAVSQ